MSFRRPNPGERGYERYLEWERQNRDIALQERERRKRGEGRPGPSPYTGLNPEQAERMRQILENGGVQATSGGNTGSSTDALREAVELYTGGQGLPNRPSGELPPFRPTNRPANSNYYTNPATGQTMYKPGGMNSPYQVEPTSQQTQTYRQAPQQQTQMYQPTGSSGGATYWGGGEGTGGLQQQQMRQRQQKPAAGGQGFAAAGSNLYGDNAGYSQSSAPDLAAWGVL